MFWVLPWPRTMLPTWYWNVGFGETPAAARSSSLASMSSWLAMTSRLRLSAVATAWSRVSPSANAAPAKVSVARPAATADASVFEDDVMGSGAEWQPACLPESRRFGPTLDRG